MPTRMVRPLVALSLALSSCGGASSPTAPATPPPTPAPTPAPVLTFADGISEVPLTPQSVTPPNPKLGDMLTVALDGYMTRQQQWTGSRIELWPLPDRQEQELAYQDLVYDGKNARPLLKWAGTRYTAVIAPMTPEWADREAEIRDRLSGVFADVAAAGGPVFAWATSGAISTGADLTVRVDARNECLVPDYVACTNWWYSGNTITKAELVFDSPDDALTDSLTMHMMGYAIGLCDWGQVRSVMNPDWSSRIPTFHELERNAVHMMYQHRAAGNVLPDRDPGFTSSTRSSGFASRREHRAFELRRRDGE